MLPDAPASTPIFAPIFTAPILAGVESAVLFVLQTEVAAVHKILTEQITALQNLDFPDKGAVPAGSYGQGHESYVLATEHKRAHGVIVDSLVEMRADLGAFQDAILAAQAVIGETDEQAETDLQKALARTQGLDLGVNTDNDDDGVNY
ncbi:MULTISPECIES: hypothetical protein [unclassified Nocardioides]|jgi:hypothetical protein|uniref:hypothetical protein n=1 Tax=unclassified Nocardioides TaxID=2615069 RepID=UPI0011501BF1|nr:MULTISPECIES: hypothetical protein [unclassified Nocardioides]TQK69994.1 hypothetical protein FBY23_1761 [Nocardioides sp. SLBN-35]WGY00769.1 hypothetical protein QI633_19800 [Nocardioides sp. QY071]